MTLNVKADRTATPAASRLLQLWAMSSDQLDVIARSICLGTGGIEIVVCLDLVVAAEAHHGVVSERAKALGLVLFLQVDQFTGVAPSLLVLWFVAVLDEAQGNAAVLYKMPTHRSNPRAPVMPAVNLRIVAH